MLINKKFDYTIAHLSGHVEWIFAVNKGSSLNVCARVNGSLVGLRFSVNHTHAKYGHDYVHKFGEYVCCDLMGRDYLLKLVHYESRQLMTVAELAEYEVLQQNTVSLAEKRIQQEKDRRYREYLELKAEFGDE